MRSSTFPNKSLNKNFLICVLPLIVFIIGCYVHYQRGYYYIDLSSTHAQGSDDAYISYRYGWNLAHFSTLSWNESGFRRTEGFTNPLWVYFSAGWARLARKDQIYPWMVATSIILTSSLLLILIHLTYKTYNQSQAAIAGILFAAATPAIWLHTTSGLESGLFGISLAVLAFIVLFANDRQTRFMVIILLSCLAGLLRSDGFVYIAILTIGALIAGSKNWKYIALGLLISTAILLTWRQLEFQAWIPNTATAKVNFSLQDRIRPGSVLLLISMLNSGLITFLLFGIAGLITQSPRIRLAGLWIIIAWLAYYLYIGGDLYLERHLVGLFFILAIFSIPLWTKTKSTVRVLLAIVLIASIALSVFQDDKRFAYFSPKVNDPLVMLGKAVEEDRARYGVLLSAAAGKIPFFAGGDCIDPFGLNDPYLSTLKRNMFTPGHSAGSEKAALEIARAHPSGKFSTFSFIDISIISGPEDISLWVDNYHPQETVQSYVSPAQWEAVLETGDSFYWSIISQPFQVLK